MTKILIQIQVRSFILYILYQTLLTLTLVLTLAVPGSVSLKIGSNHFNINLLVN